MFGNMDWRDIAKHLDQKINDYYYGSSIFRAMSDPKFVEAWHERVEKILCATTTAGRSLACRGWFFSIMLLSRELRIIRSLPGKNDEEIDEIMSEIYSKRLSYIREQLCYRFPDRCNLINETFQAHENKWYNLSVLGFLSLADGIFIELSEVEKGVYSKKRKTSEPVSKGFVDQMNLEDSMLIYLEPLRIPTALNAAKDERDPNMLNRHAAMHGTSTDYGTEINSLKALSYLYSVWTNIEAAQSRES